MPMQKGGDDRKEQRECGVASVFTYLCTLEFGKLLVGAEKALDGLYILLLAEA